MVGRVVQLARLRCKGIGSCNYSDSVAKSSSVQALLITCKSQSVNLLLLAPDKSKQLVSECPTRGYTRGLGKAAPLCPEEEAGQITKRARRHNLEPTFSLSHPEMESWKLSSGAHASRWAICTCSRVVLAHCHNLFVCLYLPLSAVAR